MIACSDPNLGSTTNFFQWREHDFATGLADRPAAARRVASESPPAQFVDGRPGLADRSRTGF